MLQYGQSGYFTQREDDYLVTAQVRAKLTPLAQPLRQMQTELAH